MKAPKESDLNGAVRVNLKRLRTKAGLSQESLAREAGITQGAVACIETGRRVPSLRMIQRLAEALGATERDLIKKVG